MGTTEKRRGPEFKFTGRSRAWWLRSLADLVKNYRSLLSIVLSRGSQPLGPPFLGAPKPFSDLCSACMEHTERIQAHIRSYTHTFKNVSIF